MLAFWKVISETADRSSRFSPMLCSRFSCASASASSDTSMLVICKLQPTFPPTGFSIECRRSGIQPVPVHISRMRNVSPSETVVLSRS